MSLLNYVIKACEDVEFNLHAALPSVLNCRKWFVSRRTFMAVEGYEGVCRPRTNLHAFRCRKISASAGNVTPSLLCCPTLSLVSVVTDPMRSGLLCCKRGCSGWLL